MAPIVANIEYRETGVILEVRPRIDTNNVVALEIAQEVSRVEQPGRERRDENPTIVQRRISSTVNVTSGQPVVLGGLIQDSTLQSSEKVPVLGDIPVLGNLFRSQSDQSVRTELIVFITPRVIRNAEDARDISEELRSRMRAAQSAAATRTIPPPAPPLQPAPAAPPPPPAAAPRSLTPSSAEAAEAEAVVVVTDVATPAPATTWLGGMRFAPATAVIAPPAESDDAAGLAFPTLAAPAAALLTVIGWWLLLLALIDAEHGRLPDVLTLPLAATGVAAATLLPLPGLVAPCASGLGAVTGFLLFVAVDRLYRAWRGRVGLGRGDAKLLAALGAWLRLEGLAPLILLAAVAAIGLALLRGQRRGDDALAFGPWLALAGFGLFWWQLLAAG